MCKALEKELSKVALSVIHTKIGTVYFCFESIKVRFSDHASDSTDSDIDIYCNKNTYILIPHVGTFKQVQWFNNARDVAAFVCRFNEMAKIMLKPYNYVVKEVRDNAKHAQQATAEEGYDNLDMTYELWKKTFSSFYNSNTSGFQTLMDNIFKLSPDEATVDKLKIAIGCKSKAAYEKAKHILAELQKR